jgi:hypothetical protein
MKATMAIARHPPIKVILVAAVQAAVDLAAAVMAAAVEVALVPRAVALVAHQCPRKSLVPAKESSSFSMVKKALASFR